MHVRSSFRLAFANRSPTPVAVDPTDAYGVVTKKLSVVEQVHVVEEGKTQDGIPNYEVHPDTLSTADTLHARTPERVLLQIEKERTREEAEAQNDAAAHALFFTLDVVNEIVSDPESPDERTADATDDTEEQLRRAEDRAENRRTTLVPGMRTTGFVVVPADPKAARLVLYVDLGARTVTVPFRQRRYKP